MKPRKFLTRLASVAFAASLCGTTALAADPPGGHPALDDIPENERPLLLEATLSGLDEGVKAPEHIPFSVLTKLPDGDAVKDSPHWTRIVPNIEGKTVFAEPDATSIVFSVWEPVVDGYDLDTRYYATYAKPADGTEEAGEREVLQADGRAEIMLGELTPGTPIRIENTYKKSERKTGTVSVTETVSGGQEGAGPFSYKVSFTRKNGDSEEPASDLNCYYPESGIYVEKGAAEFSLNDKETVTFCMLDEGLSYQITPVPDDKFTGAGDGASGTVEAGKSVSINFTHSLKTEGGDPDDGDKPGTENPDNKPDDGDKPGTENPDNKPDDGDKDDGTQTPDDGDKPGTENPDNKPDDGDKPGTENPDNKPDDGDKDDGTQTPDDGDKPGTENPDNKPDDGDKPGTENPDDGDKDDGTQTPDDGNSSDADKNDEQADHPKQRSQNPAQGRMSSNGDADNSGNYPKTGLTDHIAAWTTAGVFFLVFAGGLFLFLKKRR